MDSQADFRNRRALRVRSIAGLCGLMFLTFGPLIPLSAQAQVSTRLPDCDASVIGPTVDADGAFTYTLDPAQYKGAGNKCIWVIENKEFPNDCQPLSHTFKAADKGKLAVPILTVQDSSNRTLCQTSGPRNNFNIGERKKYTSKQLEVEYPEINGQKITTRTTPAGLIGYVFAFALTAVGLAALFSLLYSGAQWLLGNSKEALKRLSGVIIGAIFLFATFIILNFINPELIRLKDPKLPNIDIRVPVELLGTLKHCQELGASTTCESYGKDVTTCLNNSCRVAGDFCNIGPSGNCYSVKTVCEKVKTCDQYITVDGLSNGEHRRNACEFDVCKIAGQNKCSYNDGVFSFGAKCLDKATELAEKDIDPATQIACLDGTLLSCDQYKNAQECLANVCKGVPGNATARALQCGWSKGFGNYFDFGNSNSGDCRDISQECKSIHKCEDYNRFANGAGTLNTGDFIRQDNCIANVCGVEGACNMVLDTTRTDNTSRCMPDNR